MDSGPRRAVGLEQCCWKTAYRRRNVLYSVATCDGPKVMSGFLVAASILINHLATIDIDFLCLFIFNIVKFLLGSVCKREKSMLWSARWFWTPMLMKPRLQTRRMSVAQSADRFSGLIHFATSMAHLASRLFPAQATAHSICFETAATKVPARTSFSN